MDLLRGAYASDDDAPGPQDPAIAPSKRRRPEYVLPDHPNPTWAYRRWTPDQSLPYAGRYVSKRERALLGSSHAAQDPKQNPTPPPPVLGDISDSNLPIHIQSILRQRRNSYTSGRVTPAVVSRSLLHHRKPVNSIQWSHTRAHLLASASMDNDVCIWNVWSKEDKKARIFRYHNAAVKDVQWSPLEQFILSCGFDCSSRLVDIEKGIETQVFEEEHAVTVIKFNPDNPHLFLSGGSRGLLKLWDIRAGTAVHVYVKPLGPILDVEFMADGKQFISSSDVSGSNISENSLIVWDTSREIPLSNQVYAEAYTCPCVRRHPSEPFFVAQSNGNYIAIFSTKHPYRLDKYKRYESHGVSGFPIKCEFSTDGKTLASGSSNGEIYFYDVQSSKVVRKIKAHDQPCIDIAFHPVMPGVIASCSWSGDIFVSE